jgi:hypothetical protein
MEFIKRVEQMEAEHDALYEELQKNPFNMDELFKTIAKTLRHDYVGFEQKYPYYDAATYNTYLYTNYRYGMLTINMMARSMNQFTVDMHDRNLQFHCDDWIDYRNLAAKYRVRATEDCLYVTEAAPETGLVPGDKILEVQSLEPYQVRKLLHKRSFYSNEPERELWGGYLRMAESLKVEHSDGTVETMKMKLYPAEEVSYEVSYEKLDADTSYVKLEIMDYDRIEAMLQEHGEEIAASKKLILDLRKNMGGDEYAGTLLFPYLVDQTRTYQELLQDEGCYVNFTALNCERRYDTLEACKEGLTDEEEIAMLEAEQKFYQDHYGHGMEFVPAEQGEDETYEPAAPHLEKIILLTDTFCEKEGEQFVAMAQRCGKKVVTIGRPTMGTLDYFDPIHMVLNEHMTLSYPIRMTKAAYEGRGISEKGLPVDEYISWTPEEIKTDVILKRAREM